MLLIRFRFYRHFLIALLIPLVLVLPDASSQTRTPPPPNNGQSNPMLAHPPVYAGDYFHTQKKIYRWSDQTKFVLVHVSTASYMNDWQQWNPQIIKDAFGEWQRALNNRLIFVFMDDTTQADIVVNWWPMATARIETGASGINMKQTWGNYIAKNDIFIALHAPDGRPYPPRTLYATALHEIGHSLGIEEHSDSPHDMMYRTITEQSHLSQRDINTALRIYTAKPHYTNPPGYHLSRFEDFRKTQKGKGGFWIPIIIPIPI